MTVMQWVALATVMVAIGIMLFTGWVCTKDVEKVQADRDEDAANIANLRADLAETRDLLVETRRHVQALAQHITSSEPASSGRHARIAA